MEAFAEGPAALPFEAVSASVGQTREAGARLARILLRDPSLPRFVALDGDLGAGKTEFVRGFVSVASPGSSVKSPTYTLVNEYSRGGLRICHVDAYRIKDADDLYSTGFYDYPEDCLFLVEWASLIPYALPVPRIGVSISAAPGGDVRTVRCAVVGPSGGLTPGEVPS
jgi:tRNA threonylcarbamoyladenosine biosynthesis protein TsaE